jgi:hypothetical protein
MLTILALFLAFATDESAVREAAEGWTTAAVKQDTAALERYLADDLQYAHAGGQTQNKGAYIAAVTSGPPRYESFTFSDVKMVGQNLFRVRTLQVYVKRDGRWRMAAHQSTRMDR